MNTEPKAGEIWIADLGFAAKTRPILVLAYPDDEDARALVVVAALTGTIRGIKGEVYIGKPRFLEKESAVVVQSLASLDKSKLVKRLGVLSNTHLDEVKEALKVLLQLTFG